MSKVLRKGVEREKTVRDAGNMGVGPQRRRSRADRSRVLDTARTSSSGSNTLGLHKPMQRDIPVKNTETIEFRKAAISFVPGFMGVLKTQKDGQLSEGDEGACRLVISDLAGVFLIGLVSAAMRFALNAPMPPPDLCSPLTRKYYPHW